MANYSVGTVALILFFSLTFAIYAASDYVDTNKKVEYELNETGYMNKTSTDSTTMTYGDIIDEFLSPELLAGTAIVATGAAVITGSGIIAIAAAASAYLATYMLAPMAVIRAIGLPPPFDWLLYGFMYLLLIISIMSFVRGTPW